MHLYQKFSTWLDGTSMYRATLNALIFLWVCAMGVSFVGKLPFSFVSLLTSFFLLNITAILAHKLFARIYGAPANIESSLISAYILFFIAKPVEFDGGIQSALVDAGWVALLAFTMVAGKYVIAWKNKHIFNPAALALVVLGVVGAPLALWWVATPWMLIPVVLAGLTIAKKLRCFGFVSVYLTAMLLLTVTPAFWQSARAIDAMWQFAASSPWIFLGVFMLTEPSTSPRSGWVKYVYVVVVAVVSILPLHAASYAMTPELALLVGNLFAFAIGMKERITLTLKERVALADNTEEFVFEANAPIAFKAGQYMEWALPHENADQRGVRRYFTIASAPEEKYIRLATKFVPESVRVSSFKAALKKLAPSGRAWVTGVGGDFVLPKDMNTPLVFIAGGIGVTPFASMVRDMLLRNEKRDVTIFLANRKEADIPYKELFAEAEEKFGVRVVHVLSQGAPDGWKGEIGFLSVEIMKKYVSGPLAPMYYLSGPSMMVENYSEMLEGMGVSSARIKTDYFPGFA